MFGRHHVLVVASLLLLPTAAVAGGCQQLGEAKHPIWDLSLVPADEPGEPFVLEGRVIGNDSQPLRDVLIYAYHADAAAQYALPGSSNPRLAGLLRTHVLGGYRIRSILPGPAEGISHVHFMLAGPGSDTGPSL